LGILLRSVGAALSQHERCEVYLTNALTGWEPPKEPKTALLFPELEKEAERASKVKLEKPILVILGNPPYNRFAGVAEDEEADLIEPYKEGLYQKWGIRKQLLDDLYIRFFRLAEKRIAEVGGRGIVCYISNYSWLDGLSHPVMREHLVTHFDTIWIDNCNGDKYRTGKRTPDGRPDESMFTTDDHRVGIQVGTAVATLVKRGRTTEKPDSSAQVLRRDLWGRGNEKRATLLTSLTGRRNPSVAYYDVTPRADLRWVLAGARSKRQIEYDSWCKLADLFPIHYSGLNENRFNAFISIDREEIERRMKAYFDDRLSLVEIAERVPGVDAKVAGYDPAKVRKSMLAETEFTAKRIVPLSYRPFDDWWVYWEGRFKLFNRPRPDFFEQVQPGNVFIAASQTARKGGFNQPIIVNKLGDLHLQDPWSQYFPLLMRVTGELGGERVEPNINHYILLASCELFGNKPFEKDEHTWSKMAFEVAERVFYHSLAILWSPAYRQENESALRQDWARVPIPADPDVFVASAKLGRAVAEMLLPDEPVPGVTTGKILPGLRPLGEPHKVGGRPIDPDADLKVEAGWGFRGQKNAVMCGKGKVVPHPDDACLLDIYLNDQVYWANVPADVWTMTIGGYPVIKKWLSYREYKILGRPLRLEEMTHITEVVRRLKALLLLGGELDTNYSAASARTLDLLPTAGKATGDAPQRH
jgi:predicted helicase